MNLAAGSHPHLSLEVQEDRHNSKRKSLDRILLDNSIIAVSLAVYGLGYSAKLAVSSIKYGVLYAASFINHIKPSFTFYDEDSSFPRCEYKRVR